jgi:hypothetical protein
MEWVAGQLNRNNPAFEWRVADAETYEPKTDRKIYRFFELFDLPNLPRVPELMSAASNGAVRVTPPFKPWSREKCGPRFLDATPP